MRNRIRQKAGEVQAFRTLERGVEKWCREHTQRHESSPISEEGQNLLDNTDRWCDQASILKECYESRKRERIHEDGSFRHHQKGSITTTYTSDWLLRPGEYRRKLGEWLKGTSVNSQDQRRMLQAIANRFPSNVWINRITKGKESSKCDLCKALWIKENRFTTETDLPDQDLGHIQHSCEALAEAHTAPHHRCCRLIHGELSQLASPNRRFMCISGEKNLETIWQELEEEFREDIQ